MGDNWDGSTMMGEGPPPEESTVDEMKVQTMYKMVDDVHVKVQGQQVVKKVLYLTNYQASLFNEQAMTRCIQALDIGEPKFIIRLAPSTGVASQMQIAHEERTGQPNAEYAPSTYQSSEIDKSDEQVIESQIILFMKLCILPLAQQTRAVIIVGGANDCYLSSALGNVALAEQARLGKDCPFQVVATVLETEIHSRCIQTKDSHSLAAQLAHGSKAWRRRLPVLSKTFATIYHENAMQRCDMTPAASHYIVFEGLDEGEGNRPRVNTNPKRNFESLFLSCLTKKLPSIAIQSHHIEMGLNYLNELASRNIPVLLLDTNERAISMRKTLDNNAPTTQLARRSNAFPNIPITTLNQIQIEEDGNVSLAGRLELLKIAFDIIESSWTELIKEGVVSSLNTPTLAFLHSALTVEADIEAVTSGSVPLHARINELDKLRRSNKDSKKRLIPPELVLKAISFIETRVPALKANATLAKVEKWIEKYDDTHALYTQAVEFRDKIKIQCDQIASDGNILKEYVSPEMWLSEFDILTSPNVFSGSIHDIDDLKRILGSVAKIDRLPEANSLEALRALQDAWDHLEVYQLVADSYKAAAKLSYQFLLCSGVLIVFFVILDASTNFNFSCRWAVIALSFFESAIAAYVTFTNPAMRWQQLRVAAVTIESNIWIFRTRSGVYRTVNDNYDNRVENIFVETLQSIKTSVLEGADIRNTAFFSRATSQNQHGQHALTNAGFGVQDNYFNNRSQIRSEKFSNWFPFCCWRPSTILPIFNENNTVDTNLKFEQIIQDENNMQSTAKSVLLEEDEIMQVEGNIQNKAKSPEVALEYNLGKFLDKLRNYDPDGDQLTVDSHYEPVQPDLYIRFRVIPMLNFFKKRIPRCNRIRNYAQALLVIGSMGSGILSIAGIPLWAAVISAVSAAVIAYIEFQGVNSKLGRYSSTVHALQALVMWWETLPQIDRSVIFNIDRLVLTCEDLLQGEQQAWRSSSQTMKMLQSATSKEVNLKDPDV